MSSSYPGSSLPAREAVPTQSCLNSYRANNKVSSGYPWPLKTSSLSSFSPQMSLTFDDQFLLTVAEDGCLFTWKVFDKDGRGIKREREVGFAEEVLVTKTDMEEKVRTRSNEEGCGSSLAVCVQALGIGIQGPAHLAAPSTQC